MSSYDQELSIDSFSPQPSTPQIATLKIGPKVALQPEVHDADQPLASDQVTSTVAVAVARLAHLQTGFGGAKSDDHVAVIVQVSPSSGSTGVTVPPEDWECDTVSDEVAEPSMPQL